MIEKGSIVISGNSFLAMIEDIKPDLFEHFCDAAPDGYTSVIDYEDLEELKRQTNETSEVLEKLMTDIRDYAGEGYRDINIILNHQ